MIYGNKIHEKIANFDHDINTFSGILNLRQQYENVQAVGKLKAQLQVDSNSVPDSSTYYPEIVKGKMFKL